MAKIINYDSCWALIIRLNKFIGMDYALRIDATNTLWLINVLDHGKPMLPEPKPAICIYWFLRGIIAEKEGVY